MNKLADCPRPEDGLRSLQDIKPPLKLIICVAVVFNEDQPPSWEICLYFLSLNELSAFNI